MFLVRLYILYCYANFMQGCLVITAEILVGVFEGELMNVVTIQQLCLLAPRHPLDCLFFHKVCLTEPEAKPFTMEWPMVVMTVTFLCPLSSYYIIMVVIIKTKHSYLRSLTNNKGICAGFKT